MRRNAQPTWTTRDGREIRIRDMGDLHLVRTLHMLRRNAVKRLKKEREYAESLCLTVFSHGVAEHVFVCGGVREIKLKLRAMTPELYIAEVSTDWDALSREARRRKLTPFVPTTKRTRKRSNV